MARNSSPNGPDPEEGQMTNDEMHQLAQRLRIDSIRAAAAASSGHPTSSMSAADLMAVLMARYLHYDFDDPENPNNDHLIFSKGHASPLVYAMFRRRRRDHRRGAAHLPPVRLQAGGPPDAGPALGRRRHRVARPGPADLRRASRCAPVSWTGCPYRVWCLCGDSEMAEGSIWEAVEHAGVAGLDNIVAIIDVNRLGQRGETMHGWNLDSYAQRAEASGWHTIEIDGHDIAEIDRAYRRGRGDRGRPTMIVARTIKGYGASETADVEGKHGQPLKDPDKAIEELGNVGPIHVDVAKPESTGTPAHVRRRPVAPAAHLRGRRRPGPDAQGVRRGPGGGHGAPRRRRRRSTARSATRPTSRRRSRPRPTATSRPTSPSR